jgi:hypothetical protein
MQSGGNLRSVASGTEDGVFGVLIMKVCSKFVLLVSLIWYVDAIFLLSMDTLNLEWGIAGG